MPENRNRVVRTRVGRHVQRNIAGYLALAVALSLTPAMASHLNVKSSDIAKNAVTTPKIKNKAVSGKKMANLEGRHNVRWLSSVMVVRATANGTWAARPSRVWSGPTTTRIISGSCIWAG